MRWVMGYAMVACVIAGCGGDARVELAAADALHAVARSMELAVNEYHQEVDRYDQTRDDAVIAAFVERVRSNSQAAELDGSVADFKAALGKIREDRRVEWGRRTAAMENIDVLREVADGLHKIGLDSLNLRDEVRRYLSSWMELRRKSQETATAKGE